MRYDWTNGSHRGAHSAAGGDGRYHSKRSAHNTGCGWTF